MQTLIYSMDKLRAPTEQHREPYSTSCDNGEEYIHIITLLHSENEHSTINQLDFNEKKRTEESGLFHRLFESEQT